MGAGLFGLNAIDAHLAGEDHGLGFLAGFGETTFDDEEIEPLLLRFGFHENNSGAAVDEELGDFA